MIKNCILKLKFVQQAINAASIEGTDFGAQQSKEQIGQLKRQIAELVVKLQGKEQMIDSDSIEQEVSKRLQSLLGAVDENKVITHNKKTGLIFVGGEKLSEGTIMSLKAEAEYYSKSDMWHIINETIKDQAQKVMFEKSTSFDDMKNGKSFLYLLDLQNTILDIFKKYQPKEKPVVFTKQNMV